MQKVWELKNVHHVNGNGLCKMSKQITKKKPVSGGKNQVIRIGLIRLHWFGGKCMWGDDHPEESCNITIGLEFAHAIETKLSKEKKSGRSSFERLWDLINNPECFLLYCPHHHRLFDERTSDDNWRRDFYKDLL